MELCGDAVKIQQQQLDQLLELQELLLSNRKLELRAQQVKESLLTDQLREQMLSISSELNSKRTAHEELERDLRRLGDEVQLVTKRIDQDRSRLQTTAVSRDAIGLQHELDTLAKRQASLNEQIDGLRRELSESDQEQHRLQAERDRLEEAASLERERAKLELNDLKTEFQANRSTAEGIRAHIAPDLLEHFDKRFSRGLAIGRLRVNSCGACNMNLNAAALAAIHNVAADELASCPECQAILIR